MIKINLLPAYILERRHVRRLMQMFVVLAIVVLAAIAGITYGYARSTQKVNEDLTLHWAAGRADAQRLGSDISRLQNDKESRLDIFLKFYDEVLAHNQKVAAVLETISRYIHKAVVVKDWEVDSDQFKMTARIDSNENLAKFYENLRRCPALVSGSVKIEKVPVWPIQLTKEEGVSESTSEYPYARPEARGASPTTAPERGYAPGTAPSIPPELLERREIRIPRDEYEFTVTATLTPDYAVAPPASPLAPAEAQPGYGYGPSTGAPGPGGAPGRRGMEESED